MCHLLVRNDYAFTAVDNELTAVILATLAKFARGHPRALTQRAQIAHNHNRHFANVDVLNVVLIVLLFHGFRHGPWLIVFCLCFFLSDLRILSRLRPLRRLRIAVVFLYIRSNLAAYLTIPRLRSILNTRHIRKHRTSKTLPVRHHRSLNRLATKGHRRTHPLPFPSRHVLVYNLCRYRRVLLNNLRNRLGNEFVLTVNLVSDKRVWRVKTP